MTARAPADRRTWLAAALAALALAACSPAPAPPPSPPEPEWIEAVREGADRALLKQLLDANDDVRRAGVDVWEAARIESETAAQAASGNAWPPGPTIRPADWAEMDDTSPPADEAARIRQEFANRTRALARGLIFALGAGDVPTRVAAAKSMEAMRLATGRHLTKACDDADATVRVAAIEALCSLTSYESRYDPCLPTLRRLLDDPDWRVRAAAAHGVFAYGNSNSVGADEGRAAIPRLLELASDDHAEVRRAALSAVHWIGRWRGDPDVEPAFTKALADPAAEVRFEGAYWFQGEFERRVREGAARPLESPALATLRGLLSDPDTRVRARAAEATWTATGDVAAVISVFAEQLRDGQGTALNAPLRRLASMGPDAEPAVPSILAVLTEDTHAPMGAGTGKEAMEALYAIGPPVATTLPPLVTMLADADPARRAAAAGAVVTLDGDPAVCAAALDRALAVAKYPAVRGAILRSLGRLGVGGDPLVARLVEALAGAEAEVRGAVEGLASMGPRAAAAVPALARIAAAEGDGWTGASASMALAAVGGPAQAVAVLPRVKEWEGADDVVRIVESAGPGDAAIVPVLLAHLDESPAVVARALAEIGPAAKDALPALERRLGADGDLERIAAAEAVLRIGGDRDAALAVLLSALAPDDESPDAERRRAAAAYALARSAAVAEIPQVDLRRVSHLCRGEDQGALAFALWRITGTADPHVGDVVYAMSQYSSSPPIGLIEALGAMGPVAAKFVPVLERVALHWQDADRKDSETDVARAAIRSLGAIGPGARSALPSLRRLRRNALFRATAEEAIRRIDGQ